VSLCKICFQEVVGGVPVPSWHPDEKGDRTSVHDECLAKRVSDFVNILDAPSNEAISKVAIELGSRGTLKTMTMAAMEINDFIRVLKK